MNLENRTNAYGWAGLFNGFAGSNGSKVEAWQLLPFPTNAKPESESSKQMSDRTEELLGYLIRTHQLTKRAIAIAVMANERLEEHLR